MSNALRKLERNVIKQELRSDGRSVKRGFEDAWKDYQKKKYKSIQKVKKNTQPKKKRFFDNVKQYLHMFSVLKEMREESSKKDLIKSKP